MSRDTRIAVVLPAYDEEPRVARVLRPRLEEGGRARPDASCLPNAVDTYATSPLRLFEYSPVGKSVISTAMPACAASPRVGSSDA